MANVNINDKGTTKSSKQIKEEKEAAQRANALRDIQEYNQKYRKGRQVDERPLESLGGYGKGQPVSSTEEESPVVLPAVGVEKETEEAGVAENAKPNISTETEALIARLKKNRPQYFKKNK